MVVQKRRAFRREVEHLPYRKLFIIATEGLKTEVCYFDKFKRKNSLVKIKCIKKNNKSSPDSLIKQIKIAIKEEALVDSDEAWLVVDKDGWNDSQLKRLLEWTVLKNNYYLALTNPKFEYWLLLHFEDGQKVTAKNCSDRLRQYLPNYDKKFDSRKIDNEMINKAIERARARDKPPCTDWPAGLGSTVYRLVDNILKSYSN